MTKAAKTLSTLLLFICALSGSVESRAQVINCGSGFNTTTTANGACGVSVNGASADFWIANHPSTILSGTAVNLAPVGAGHQGNSLIKQVKVNNQAFSTTFTFVPNGFNLAFVLENQTNQNGQTMSAGAGSEAGFSQMAGGSNINPNNVFALELNSYDPSTNSSSFAHSDTQIYQPYQWPALPDSQGTSGYLPVYATNRISTTPVSLNSPTTSPGTTTGDTYNATVTYDGYTLTLNLFDVTASGACPGASCFTHSWSGVYIPEITGATTSYAALMAGTSSSTANPLLINSFTYTVNTPTGTPTYTAWNANSTQTFGYTSAASPVYSVAPGTYSGTQSVTISTSSSPHNYICYVLSSTVPTLYPQPDNNGGCNTGTLYSGAISIASTSTLYAMAGSNNSAFAAGSQDPAGLGPPSTLVAGTYTIGGTPAAAAPVFSLASGTYASPQTGNTLTSSTSGAAIQWCYTTMGGTTCDPSTGTGAAYTAPIYVGASEYLCAYATATGYTQSPTTCNHYTIGTTPLGVKFSPAGGTYSAGQTVTLSDDTVAPLSGQTVAIYYTTDGSAPDYTSPLYTSPIAVASTTTIKAIAGIIGAQILNDQLLIPNSNHTYPQPAPVSPASYPGWKSVCTFTNCGPGGNANATSATTQTQPTAPCLPGSAKCTEFSQTTASSAGQYNSLWTMVSGAGTQGAGGANACDQCTYQVSSFSAYLNSNAATASELEYDQFNFRPGLANGTTGTGSNTMYGMQCNRGSGKWQTLARSNNGGVGWVNSAVSCTPYITTLGSYQTIVTQNHIVIGDTSCTTNPAEGGTFHMPTQHYDFLIVNGTKNAWNQTNCTFPLQSGYSADVGHQYQINSSTASSTASEEIDKSSVTALFDPAPVQSATYTTSIPQAVAPSVAPGGGTYTTAQSVTLSTTTPSATIYYTLDGSTPTTSSTVYTGPITVSSNLTISSLAAASGYGNSNVATASYVYTPPAAAPAFAPTAGLYTSAQTITLSDTTPGATIYYTTDGSTPTTSSAVYGAPFVISATSTVKAAATASGYSLSTVGSATYTITIPPVAATPAFSPATGSYSGVQSVTLSSATAGASIYYTTDGSTPSTSSALYSAPLTVAGGTLKAIAIKSGYTNSSVGSATYAISGSSVNCTALIGKVTIQGKFTMNCTIY